MTTNAILEVKQRLDEPQKENLSGVFESDIEREQKRAFLAYSTAGHWFLMGSWKRLVLMSLGMNVWYLFVFYATSATWKLVLVTIAIVATVSVEVIGFLRFRHLFERGQLSDAQLNFSVIPMWVWLFYQFFSVIEVQQPLFSRANASLFSLLVTFFVALLFLSAHLIALKKQSEHRATLRASRDKAELAEAKLVALSAQIEPHFLFNTLASIQYLITNDAGKAKDMTSDLIAYLRLALPRMKQSTARLADELDLVRAYLGIMQIRMGERLQFAIDSPDELSDVQIPTMTLITLVENAIKHGLEQKPNGGTIRLSAAIDATDVRNIRLEVADTGGGFSTVTSGTGIGLANIRERLNTLYGDRARLELESNLPDGVKAVLTLPIGRK